MKKPYSAPKVKKIALKKAKLLLHNQAAHGEKSVEGLLESLQWKNKNDLKTNQA
jgi:hypothetical protein